MAEVKEHERQTASRWTRLFEEGNANQRDLLGGKGAGLAEMSRIGLPVPPGFTITTEACREYFRRDRQYPEGLLEEVRAKVRVIEERTGKRFGDPRNPLLLSVRSGAKFSMPGMMDTVLNLGMNDETIKGLIKLTNDERFVYDSYRRLVQMFGCVVMNIADEVFEDYLTEIKNARHVKSDINLTAEDWKDITAEFKKIYKAEVGKEFPQDPLDQLRAGIGSVFRSWNGKRAIDYRNAAGIPHDLGTAVSIVTMVFGNMGQDSGTGVVTTRNVSTGEKEIEGDYLTNAQGEDVVAGTRTTKPIAD